MRKTLKIISIIIALPVVFILFTLFLGSTLPIKAQSGNILINPGFESGLTNWECSIYNRATATTCRSENSIVTEGLRSARITPLTSSKQQTYLSQPGITSSNPSGAEDFCLSLWSKSAAPPGASQELRVGLSRGTQVLYGVEKIIQTTNVWQFSKYTLPAVSAGTLMDLYLKAGECYNPPDPAGNCNVYVDGITLQRGSCALQLTPTTTPTPTLTPTPAPTLAPIVTNTGSYSTGVVLTAGTYIVSLPNPLPSGYQMTYPLNSPPSFFVTLGPSCIENYTGMLCTVDGITDLNFGVTNATLQTPWIQTSGGDVHSNININTPGGP